MTASTESGEYMVTIERPDGDEWAWRGFAKNPAAALALAEMAYGDGEVAWQ